METMTFFLLRANLRKIVCHRSAHSMLQTQYGPPAKKCQRAWQAKIWFTAEFQRRGMIISRMVMTTGMRLLTSALSPGVLILCRILRT
jgi:hypothetical protein